MITSTIYFSHNLESWKEQLNRILFSYGKNIQWQALEKIHQSPVGSFILISEAELKAFDWPILASRKIVVILEEWSMDDSIMWIEKGAANCFSIHDEGHVTTWLVSALSKFIPTDSTENEIDFLQTVIDAIPVPIFYKDHFHIYRGCNTKFCESLGLDREKIIDHSVYDIAPKHLADIYHDADIRLLDASGIQRYDGQARYSDGSIHEIEFNKAVFKKPSGQIGGQVGVMLDVTESNQLLRQLDKVTRTDPLTGTANRREFNFIICEELGKQKSSDNKLSLMALDIDFFKKINDRFGHGGGDKALQLVTNWLQKQLRSTDTLFRVGGEEFYILMRDTNLQHALKAAKKICEGMSTHSFLIKQQNVQITISIGVIELTPTTELESSLEMVDRALYKAKSDGRNCVCPVLQ